MSSSIGFGLIKAVIDGTISLSTLTESGVEDSYFQGKELQAFGFLKQHFSNFGEYPQLPTIAIEIEHPTCFDSLPEEPSDFWIGRLKDRRRFHIIQDGTRSLRGLLEASNVSGAVDRLAEIHSGVRSTYTEFRAIDLKDAQREAILKHNRVQQRGRIPGIPFGFPYIDFVSGGAQRGDSIIIAGITGSGKTYLSLKVALSAWYSGHSVLYLCTEMPEGQIARRLIAMEGNFDTTHLKLGRLSYFGVERALQIIDSPLSVDGVVSDNFFKILPGGLYSKLDDIQLVTRELRPDMLIIDGGSLVRLPGFKGTGWDVMREVTHRVKDLAMTEDIVTTTTYHFNKQQAGSAEGIYGGLVMGQIASIVMAFEFERKEDRESPNPVQYRILKLLKGRDGEAGKIRVLYDMMRTSITQESVLSGYATIGEGGDNEPVDTDAQPYASI